MREPGLGSLILVFVGLLFAGLVFTEPAHGQTLPVNWYGVGAAWNQFASPQVNGWASYAKLLSQQGGIYSFTSIDITSARTVPFTAQTSIRTGAAMVMRQMGPVYVLAFGDGGGAVAGQNIGGAFSLGGVGIVRLGKTDWTLVGAVRRLKTSLTTAQSIYEFGLGRTF